MARELFYWGTSMNPTLRVGDVLRVVPCPLHSLKTGDVVVFRDPQTREQVVHRVVAVLLQGVRTQGDNCPAPDDWLLQAHDLLGRVAAYERQGRLVPLSGDHRWAGRVFQWQQHLDRFLSRMLKPAYLWLARTGLFRGRLTLRLLCFPRPEGPEWQLWLGKRLVGRRFPTSSGWAIRRPFRLFVDEATLPGEDTGPPDGHGPAPFPPPKI